MIKRLTNLNKVVYEDPHRQFYHKNALDLAFSARTSPASELGRLDQNAGVGGKACSSFLTRTEMRLEWQKMKSGNCQKAYSSIQGPPMRR
jgi:hypothetical protein